MSVMRRRCLPCATACPVFCPQGPLVAEPTPVGASEAAANTGHIACLRVGPGRLRDVTYQPHALTRSLVQPPAAVQIIPDLLQLATDALAEVQQPMTGAQKAVIAARTEARARARAFARAIDWSACEWFWLEGGREWDRRHDKSAHAVFEGAKTPSISKAVRREVAERDGWRCRYCSLRVVASSTMTKLEALLPEVLPMGPAAVTSHPAQCILRLTWDHVVPHASGGSSGADNVVASCGGCNFNKGNCSVTELSLQDPRLSEPAPGDWDGLVGRLGAVFK